MDYGSIGNTSLPYDGKSTAAHSNLMDKRSRRRKMNYVEHIAHSSVPISLNVDSRLGERDNHQNCLHNQSNH